MRELRDDGAWHHIVAVFAGVGRVVYVDGNAGGPATLQATTPVCSRTVCASLDPNPPIMSIGGNGTATIDEVALYPTALSSARVSAHFNAAGQTDTSNEMTLTSAQQAQITQMATSDVSVQSILNGTPYTVGPVSVWTKFGGSSLIGGVVELDFTLPQTLTGNWPDYAYNEAENTDPVYQTLVEQFTASGVTSLDVAVDLNCNTVVSIQPNVVAAYDIATRTLAGGPVQPPACGDPPTNHSWQRNVRVVLVGNSAFGNYDYSDSVTTKPDGPINLVFWGNNFQTRSATALYQYPGDNAYGKVKYASSGWVAYNDRGYKDKNALFQCGWDTHYRVYGSAQPVPTPNTYWGYFYIGQVHHDYNDGVNCGKAKFGWHEDSEKRLAAKARTVYGDAAVQYDQVQMLNPEGQNLPKKGYADGNHWRSNDGRATKIHVCSDNQFLATKCTASGAIG